MNLKQLTRLVAKGESDRLEFKKSTGELIEGSGHGAGARWWLKPQRAGE
jgi:hypothetical protein